MTKYKENVENGLCGYCGVKNTNEKSICNKCCEKKNAYRQLVRDKWLKEGKCKDCGSQLENKANVRCNHCIEKQRKHNNEFAKARREKKLCVRCGQPTAFGHRCETCILKRCAKKYLGDKTKWTDLKDLFKSQNAKCAYSGIDLQIGINTQLDHKHPRSKGGRDEIENLQWVELNINKMKSDIPERDFLNLVKLICDHKKLH